MNNRTFDSMRRYSKHLAVGLLGFAIGIAAVFGWIYYQRIDVQLPDSRWEPLFFQMINTTTELADLEPLRTTFVWPGDIEVRVWRGFGLSNLEGVILKRVSGEWSALHIKANDSVYPTGVEVKELPPPKSDWEPFWNKLVDNGLLTLRDPWEAGCEKYGLDGTSYVVEINQNRVYRTYMMAGLCPGWEPMDELGDIIGEEFDSGIEKCEPYEWFACTKMRRSYRLESQ